MFLLRLSFSLLIALPAIAAPDTRARRLLVKADALLNQAETPAVGWKAIGYLREAAKAGVSPFAVDWRLARGYYLLSRIAKDSGRGDQGALARRGFSYGVKATRRAPHRVEGHFWAALCIGSYGETLGVISALRHGIRGKLERHLGAAARLDPGYDRGGPDRVLAIFHHSLPWPLKSNSKSIRHFKRSLNQDPDNPSTHFFYAKTLLDQDNDGAAATQLRRCTRIKSTNRSDRRYQHRCRLLLRTLK